MSGDRVLVVDDHAGFRAAARRVLEADGWSVVGEAVDGTSALAVAAWLEPDVVLLDIGLPGDDGFAIADRLAGLVSAQVVLISSREQTTYGDRIALSPAVGFIGKGELDGTSLRRLVASRDVKAE